MARVCPYKGVCGRICDNGAVSFMQCAQQFVMLELSLEFLHDLQIDLTEEASYTHISCWLWTASLTITAERECIIVFTCFNNSEWRWELRVPSPATLDSIHHTLEENIYRPPLCDCAAPSS